jgi:hypothetical protein
VPSWRHGGHDELHELHLERRRLALPVERPPHAASTADSTTSSEDGLGVGDARSSNGTKRRRRNVREQHEH